MKRKQPEAEGENEEPKDENLEKRRRKNDSWGRQWSSAAIKDVSVESVELLEDLGVNVIEDASNESTDIPSKPNPINVNHVLRQKDQNVKKTTQSCADLDLSNISVGSPCGSSFNFPTHTSSSGKGRTDHLLTSIPDAYLVYKRTPAPRTVQRDSFQLMSDEVVLAVFKWMPKTTLARCALVCKRWSILTKDDSLWRRIDLGLKSVRPGIVGQVLSRGCTVLRLSRSSIQAPIFLDPPHQTFSPNSTSKLQFLDLSMATVDTKCLEQLLSTCRNLKKLALERCDLNDEACKSIGNNPSLDVLHLALCRGISDVGVSWLLQKCRRLTELNISWTDLKAAGLDKLVDTLPASLERLNLAGYRTELQDEHVGQLVGRCRNLRELDLSDSVQITEDSLNNITTNLIRLESLSTSRCYAIPKSAYLSLLSCPSLLYLNVYGLLQDAALSELRRRLKGIEMNKFPLSSIARPTVGIKRTSLWNLRVRD